ncbi:hypothetical protein HMPREF9193_02085 [Treponema lecithinolyticum ATCC 700332]|uniref:Uncharacterized protein n=1 Tax=Treponema lecithinolyticum ATCC 700332 TaxID=1321815 RepID=A0ABN0NWC7_TRELE|nr:hypothetical protein HMPREF9193_02085 [Treponema lecithinolyticum ATCC 700332]
MPCTAPVTARTKITAAAASKKVFAAITAHTTDHGIAFAKTSAVKTKKACATVPINAVNAVASTTPMRCKGVNTNEKNLDKKYTVAANNKRGKTEISGFTKNGSIAPSGETAAYTKEDNPNIQPTPKAVCKAKIPEPLKHTAKITGTCNTVIAVPANQGIKPKRVTVSNTVRAPKAPIKAAVRFFCCEKENSFPIDASLTQKNKKRKHTFTAVYVLVHCSSFQAYKTLA